MLDQEDLLGGVEDDRADGDDDGVVGESQCPFTAPSLLTGGRVRCRLELAGGSSPGDVSAHQRSSLPALGMLGLLPQGLHLRQVGLLGCLPLPAELTLDKLKTLDEFRRGFMQCLVRIDLQEARQVDQ
jgi:hypothetical protein